MPPALLWPHLCTEDSSGSGRRQRAVGIQAATGGNVNLGSIGGLDENLGKGENHSVAILRRQPWSEQKPLNTKDLAYTHSRAGQAGPSLAQRFDFAQCPQRHSPGRSCCSISASSRQTATASQAPVAQPSPLAAPFLPPGSTDTCRKAPPHTVALGLPSPSPFPPVSLFRPFTGDTTS